MLAGCAGTGKVVDLEIRAIPSGAGTEVRSGETGKELKIGVSPFEDARSDKSRLGTRTHLGGGVTHFNVAGGKAGEAVAQVVADFLGHKGWRVWVRKPGVTEPAGGPDVTLSGQVLEFSANAKSRFFSTRIDVKTRVSLRAVNAADGSTTRMTLEGSRMQSVFWFSEEDVQTLVNEVLRDSLEKLIADTRVEGRLLKLK